MNEANWGFSVKYEFVWHFKKRSKTPVENIPYVYV